MSIYDKASLVLIPSGTKTSKVYSQKPTSGDGDFTFSRSTMATRVNADGNIEKETMNLLLQSNSFDTTWIKSNASVTSGQTGYDGTSDAWLQQSTSTFCRLDQNITQTGVLTLSAYAKAGTSDFLLLEVTRSGGVFYAWFDLSSGAVGTTSAIDASIESVGGGWYRCSLIGNQTLSGQARLRVADSNGSTTTTTSSNIYIQDAQLEQGLVARDYIETTTSAVEGGITDNVPRLDYTDSSCPALLLEPQRTNIVPNSEYFGGWQIFGSGLVTLTANQIVSPEGIQNAYLLETSTDNKGIYATCGSLSSGNIVTISVYLKQKVGGSSIVRFGTSGTSFGGDKASRFDLSDGTIEYENPANDSVSIESVGDGWYRCVITDTATASGAFAVILYSYLDGNANCDFYAYGAQAESNASYPTSYIPTYGSSVSRASSRNRLLGASNIIGQQEGTLYWDFKSNNTSNYKRLALSNGSTSNWIFVGMELDTGYIRGYIRNNNVVQFTFQGNVNLVNTRVKIALAYKENDIALYANGSLIGSSNNATIPLCNAVDMGSQNPTNYINATSVTNNAMLFKTRLSNEELADLTTL